MGTRLLWTTSKRRRVRSRKLVIISYAAPPTHNYLARGSRRLVWLFHAALKRTNERSCHCLLRRRIALAFQDHEEEQRRRKVSRSGTANKSCACAEVIYRAPEGAASRHAYVRWMRFPDLYTGVHTWRCL